MAAFNRIHSYLANIDPERLGWGYSSTSFKRPVVFRGQATKYQGLVIHLTDDVMQTAFRLCTDYTLGNDPYPSDFGLHKLDQLG